MKKILFSIIVISFGYSCTKKNPTDDSTKSDTTIVYNYTYKTFVGNTIATYVDIVDGNTVTWDTLYSDSVLVKIDSSKDRIVFTANTKNPLGVYTDTEFPFTISSGFFRKTYIQNHYQSFFFEGDTLKSYFFKLQVGSNVSYQKEIKFSGYEKP